MAFRDAAGSIPIDEWLEELSVYNPRAYAKCLSRVILLEEAGFALRRPAAALLRDGIYELRAAVGNVNYRILYFFYGQNVVVLSHGLTKEDRVPSIEIDRAVQRMRLVEANADKHLVQWKENSQ